MAELTIRMTNDDAQISKDNQIDVLEELQKFFEGHNLYLTSFFSSELVDWAVSCIENDIAPNIWADRMHYVGVTDDHRGKVHNLRAEIETIKDEYDTQYEDIEHNLIQRDETITGLQDQLELLEHLSDSLRDDLRMARERLGLLEGAATSNNIKISSLQLEIIELKAKLWDTFAEGMPE